MVCHENHIIFETKREYNNVITIKERKKRSHVSKAAQLLLVNKFEKMYNRKLQQYEYCCERSLLQTLQATI